MPRYYFDVRDGGKFTEDSEGIVLAGIEAAGEEAARGLADLARDVLPAQVRMTWQSK